MTDFLLLENIHKMIKEIPKPRPAFRKGIAVRGFFRPYMSFGDYTRADIFDSGDRITPVKVRFSSMLGDNGTADTMRNIKSMNVKLMADAGEQDILCQNVPVYFINDTRKMERIIEAFTVRGKFDKINTKKFWEFVVDNPESLNCAVRFFSWRGVSDSYIYEKWYSVNNTVWLNDLNTRTWVRYRWVPLIENTANKEQKTAMYNRTYAEFMAGFDPDRALNQLERRIQGPNYPAFELQVQMLSDDALEKSDLLYTAVWDEKRAPFIPVGTMVLNESTEGAKESDSICYAFGNTIDGIELYRDELMEMMDYYCRIESMERC